MSSVPAGTGERDAVEGLRVAAGQVVEAVEEPRVGQRVDDGLRAPLGVGHPAATSRMPRSTEADDAGGLAPVGAVEDPEDAGALAHP